MRYGLRIAGAPISWGVCEAPGWGHQMDPERVLGEVAELGLPAVEAGPDGFLPREPAEALRLLSEHGVRLVGGFVPVVVHRAELEHFLRLARGEAENPCTGRDALEALKIAIAADLSLAEHRPVSTSEVA